MEGYSTSELRELARHYRSALLDDCIPFWMRHALDWEHGGYLTCLARDGSIVDTDKGVWQQGRFAWTLSTLFNTVQQRDEWLDAARLGIEFLDRACFDQRDGRLWFHVARDGMPIRKRRYAFSESFAAIAYAQYSKATGDSHYREKSEACLHRFLKHANELPNELQKFESGRRTRGIGNPMIAIVTAQELRDAIGLTQATTLIDEAINEIEALFVRDDEQVVLECVGVDGQILDHFDGRTLNPGHAIECAWFIMREGRLRHDRRLIQLGAKMLDWMWNRGWDQQHGGLLYFVDLHGGDVQEYWHDMKFWWPHNEATIATLLASAATGDPKYTEWHRQVHQWSLNHFADSEHGEWFGYLHRDGSVSSHLKGNLWKGPFHLPRMLMVCWQLAEEMLADVRSAEDTTH